MFAKALQALIVAGAISVFTTGNANSQFDHVNLPTSYQREVDTQINAVIAASRNNGFPAVVSNRRGQMYTGSGDSVFTVHLEAGVTYRFEARCDRDCSDLDMALRDSRGREMIADRDVNDTPGFTFTPHQSGTYQVRLELFECRAYRCQVGAVVMAAA
jgi:hypothetical protein